MTNSVCGVLTCDADSRSPSNRAESEERPACGRQHEGPDKTPRSWVQEATRRRKLPWLIGLHDHADQVRPEWRRALRNSRMEDQISSCSPPATRCADSAFPLQIDFRWGRDVPTWSRKAMSVPVLRQGDSDRFPCVGLRCSAGRSVASWPEYIQMSPGIRIPELRRRLTEEFGGSRRSKSPERYRSISLVSHPGGSAS
jgi:hypothetical protein